MSASLGGSVAQADWLGPKVGGCSALCCIRQMHPVNSLSGSATVTALQTLSWLLLYYYKWVDFPWHATFCDAPVQHAYCSPFMTFR